MIITNNKQQTTITIMIITKLKTKPETVMTIANVSNNTIVVVIVIIIVIIIVVVTIDGNIQTTIN